MTLLLDEISRLKEEVHKARVLALDCAAGDPQAEERMRMEHGIMPSQIDAYLSGLGVAEKMLGSMVLAGAAQDKLVNSESDILKIREMLDSGRRIAEFLMGDDDQWESFAAHIRSGKAMEDHPLYQAHVAASERPYFTEAALKFSGKSQHGAKMNP